MMLRGCAGCFESSLGVKVSRYISSRYGSIHSSHFKVCLWVYAEGTCTVWSAHIIVQAYTFRGNSMSTLKRDLLNKARIFPTSQFLYLVKKKKKKKKTTKKKQKTRNPTIGEIYGWGFVYIKLGYLVHTKSLYSNAKLIAFRRNAFIVHFCMTLVLSFAKQL